MTTVCIASRFCGPPASGNGGYVAGLLAGALGGSDCEVSLLKPPPLDRELEIRLNAEGATLMDGADVIASAITLSDFAVPPLAPPLELVETASRAFTGLSEHIFPGCFVCGPDRKPGDGLRIFPGALEGDMDRVAAPWIADASLIDARGGVATEFVWAALDCPGYFAVQAKAGLAVLGRLAVRIVATVPAGETLTVIGWSIESVGRKHRVGTALYDARGCALGFGHATWIALKA